MKQLLIVLGCWLFTGARALPPNANVARVANSSSYITNDSYFYGLSPPVYPSPSGNGTGAWADAYVKAKAFVAQLTEDEKINMTAGASSSVVDNSCSGNIQPITRLGFPGMCITDAGQGVRGADYVNGWSTGLHAGVSWNKELVKQRAIGLGAEFQAKGANMILGPVVGPLGRIAKGGRFWETFGADPYHAGILVAESIFGTQSMGVATSTKHFIANEQETNRMPSTNDDGLYVQAVSTNIDDKTLHELYMWPFQDALRAGTTCVMCSYQRLNNSYSCQNSKLLNGLLKEELGFQGYVISDWTAQHAGIASAEAGLDIAMPDTGYWGQNISLAIANGTMESSRLDDMVTRLMATWYLLDQETLFPNPGVGLPSSVSVAHQAVSALGLGYEDTLLQSAIEGHVLLKNENNALPLQSPRLISVFGYDAQLPTAQDFTSEVYTTTPYYVNYSMWSAGGSGQNTPSYIDAPINAFLRKAREDKFQVAWDFDSQDPTVDATTDACFVFLNAYAIEGADRQGLFDDYSDTLVSNVAGNCNNTMVVIHNAGIRIVDAWIEHPNVTALIYAHMPGQDLGQALLELLWGSSNSWGRLPYTVAKSESDYGALLDPAQPEGEFLIFPQDDFTEGIYTDYRYFDANNIEPRYEFGYGLTYTIFNYSNLVISTNGSGSIDEYPAAAETEQGGNPHLWDTVATVTATVANTGTFAGYEVAQLYVGIPEGPIRQLRGFEKVFIDVDNSGSVQFNLTRRDLSTWDTVAQDWYLPRGYFAIYVGRSSRDLPLTGGFTV